MATRFSMHLVPWLKIPSRSEVMPMEKGLPGPASGEGQVA